MLCTTHTVFYMPIIIIHALWLCHVLQLELGPTASWICSLSNHHQHGLRTPGEEIAFTARPKIKSQSQIFRYGRSIFLSAILAKNFRFLCFMPSLGDRSPWVTSTAGNLALHIGQTWGRTLRSWWPAAAKSSAAETEVVTCNELVDVVFSVLA